MAQPAVTRDRTEAAVTINKTLVAADSGVVQNVLADAITITLPAAAAGLTYTIRNGGLAAGGTVGSGSNGSVLVNVTPNGTDTVSGNGFTAAAGKGLQNIKATSLVGDEVTITGVSGGWFITNVVGVWTRQP